ncbi:SDR family oxidoreductase [Paracoccus sp. 1_MG-2023]|uniref:SDR family oxidoreductase n=1 Tax=unclassified Paracoccus (in: a-proteobacteria) TaxID=2688777 RepID=UPI001C0978DB|nr:MULTISPECIES: SDR family oxidoreductase [unclassified Paracoccus (in: a-proteobacteria)]MBU2957965.1 SDR family oxidoreductase [Paracoccus sp. C2R09]MDO6668841.1 SDR family oxidoreductase [Paracoccus sp. 1_MG-2023]
MVDLDGKVALVTGASRGIGAATARLLAQAGAKVGVMARSTDAVTALAEEIGGVAMSGDVADPAAMVCAVTTLHDKFGRIDVLINNAGLIGPIAGIDASDPDEWGKAIDVNIKGVFNGIHAALPHMRKAGAGTILTVGSGAAHAPQEGWSAYCSSKAGALMLTRAVDLEARKDGIRAISLSPGTVATDMQAAIRDSGVNPVSQLDWSVHIPPEWPARALLWMCGPEADEYLGAEISLRDEGIRRRVGLID